MIENAFTLFIKVKTAGGIKFNSTVPLSRIDEKLVQMILQQYKIHNAEILFREDATPDQFIDVIVGNRKYMNCLYVYNKIDQGRTDCMSFLFLAELSLLRNTGF